MLFQLKMKLDKYEKYLNSTTLSTQQQFPRLHLLSATMEAVSSVTDKACLTTSQAEDQVREERIQQQTSTRLGKPVSDSDVINAAEASIPPATRRKMA